MVLETEGVQLHYETVGEGEPLLWIHGFLGAGADWRYMFAGVPAGYRLIVPDLRGHGRSPATSEFSFLQAGRDVLALMDHLHIERAKAIGVSGGGIALLHAATADPARWDAIVLVSAPPYFPPQARAIQRQTSAAMFDPAELELMRQRHAGGEAQMQQLFAAARGLAERYDDVNFTPPYLATIAARTLLVFGDRDPLYPVSLAFELHAAIPGSSLWVVPNGGHAPVFGAQAATFVETALAFLTPPS